jgi:hypothetical protein
MNTQFPKEQFWFVWCLDGGNPSRKHPTLEVALGEAKRLARSNPDSTFVVLESVAAVAKRDVDIVSLKPNRSSDDDIPF